MKFFINLILLSFLILTSCNKDVFEPINEKNFIIETVKIENGVLHFESLKQFLNAIGELNDFSKEYQEYFNSLDNFKNSKSYYQDFINSIDYSKLEESKYIDRLKEKWQGKVTFLEDEFEEKFDMGYKNYFCDVTGIINIGGEYFKYIDNFIINSSTNNIRSLLTFS